MMCISLASQSYEECIKAIGKSQYAELRIDLLDFSIDQLKALFSIKRQTIATCRPGKYDDVTRKELLKMAMDAGAGFVDIEFESDPEYRDELVQYAKSCGSLAIISYHNFEITPVKKELIQIIEKSKLWGADRVKIATMAITRKDNARIMSLYEDHDQIIAFCMGKLGKITRIAAPILGADFTFVAYSSKETTAPGQIIWDDMIDIYENIGIDY